MFVVKLDDLLQYIQNIMMISSSYNKEIFFRIIQHLQVVNKNIVMF